MVSNGVTIFWLHIILGCHLKRNWILGDMNYFFWVHGIGILCQLKTVELDT